MATREFERLATVVLEESGVKMQIKYVMELDPEKDYDTAEVLREIRQFFGLQIEAILIPDIRDKLERLERSRDNG